MDLFTILLLVMVAAGAVMVYRQLRFGTAAQRLARTLAAEGGLDRDALPRNDKGKVEPEAAAAQLVACKAEVDADPNSWRAWFKLGVAYGDMHKPREARAAVHRAVAVERAHRPQP
jgi:cytochrome c-type biogenesis protein CcmH/NrfG